MILDKKCLTGVVFGVSTVLSAATPISGYESEIARAHIKASPSSYSVSVEDTFTLGSTFDENTFIGTRDTFEHAIEPVKIVQNAIEQINQLNYIKVDDAIDREIDAYFAKRELKKVKKILLKGRKI